MKVTSPVVVSKDIVVVRPSDALQTGSPAESDAQVYVGAGHGLPPVVNAADASKVREVPSKKYVAG